MKFVKDHFIIQFHTQNLKFRKLGLRKKFDIMKEGERESY